MNIKDDKFLDLRNVLFINPDGKLIYGEFHPEFAMDFFGSSFHLTERERLERKERILMFLKYKDQSSDLSSIPFLIRYYRHDMVAYRTKTIVTTREPAMDTYFNYYLNGYSIKTERPLLYDENNDKFYTPEYDAEILKRELILRKEAKTIINQNVPQDLPNFYR